MAYKIILQVSSLLLLTGCMVENTYGTKPLTTVLTVNDESHIVAGEVPTLSVDPVLSALSYDDLSAAYVQCRTELERGIYNQRACKNPVHTLKLAFTLTRRSFHNSMVYRQAEFEINQILADQHETNIEATIQVLYGITQWILKDLKQESEMSITSKLGILRTNILAHYDEHTSYLSVALSELEGIKKYPPDRR